MNKHLQSELWEIQVILYWILGVLLFNNDHPYLGWTVMVWGTISFIGAIVKKAQAVIEDKK